MPIVSIMRDWGSSPAAVRITTTDTLAQVAVTDYMLSQEAIISELNKGAWEWVVGDLVAVSASDGNNIFSFTGNDFDTLIELPGGGGGGNVVLPTVAGRIAHFTDADGTISSDSDSINVVGDFEISDGFLVVGKGDGSGQANSIVSIQSQTPLKGTLNLVATDNTDNFAVTITNGLTTQSVDYKLPETFTFADSTLLGKVAPITNGNFISATAFDGLMVDSGVNAASVNFAISQAYTVTDTPAVASTLAAGGTQPIIPASGFSTYKIRAITVNAAQIPFSGGGGDRNIDITDGTQVYTTISAALIQSAGTNAAWGSVDVPYPSFPANSSTTFFAAIPLYLVYSGGTTDYTDGLVQITVAYNKN